MFADAAQERADPEQGSLRLVNPEKNGLPDEQHDELAKLRALELEEGWWLWCAAPALEQGESGQDFLRGCDAEVQLNLERDCVAGRGGGKIGRKKKAEHRSPRSFARRLMARRKSSA